MTAEIMTDTAHNPCRIDFVDRGSCKTISKIVYPNVYKISEMISLKIKSNIQYKTKIHKK